MAEGSEIARLVAKAEKEVSFLEERLREAKVYLKGLRDAVKASSSSSDQFAPTPQDAQPAKPTPATTGDEQPREVPSRLRSGTALADVRDAILAAGRPLYINDILTETGRSEEDRASVVASISRYAGKGEVFVRTDKNTFGLLELKHGPKEE